MTFHSSLMADRSCWHDGARLRTPSSAAASRGAQQQPSNPPRPQGHGWERRRCPHDLGDVRFAQTSTRPGLGFMGRKRSVLSLAEKWDPPGSGPDHNRAGHSEIQGLSAGPALTSGCGWGLPRGLSSTPGTDSELLCSGWSLFHEF